MLAACRPAKVTQTSIDNQCLSGLVHHLSPYSSGKIMFSICHFSTNDAFSTVSFEWRGKSALKTVFTSHILG